jgi:NAD(P)H-dependent FMN reductase
MSVKLALVLGTNREGNWSRHVYKFMLDYLKTRDDVVVRGYDPAESGIPEREDTNVPEFNELVQWAEGFVLISPEYNHSFTGTLKTLLDSELGNYLNKSVGYVGVSKGQFSGVRMIESLSGVTRELGLIDHGYDMPISNVREVFSETGELLDENVAGRAERFIDHLVWLTTTLNEGRKRRET